MICTSKFKKTEQNFEDNQTCEVSLKEDLDS